MQSRLTVTSKGQVTLRKELLNHLGIKPGDSLIVDFHQPGRAEIKAAPRQSIEAFFGCLSNHADVHLSIDEINEAIRKGWAGEL